MSGAEEARSWIADECDRLKALLLEKNDAYGNSALEPLRLFSKASPSEQLRVRIDDKLSRLARGHDGIEADAEVLRDLAGYLVLLLVVLAMPQPEPQEDRQLELFAWAEERARGEAA